MGQSPRGDESARAIGRRELLAAVGTGGILALSGCVTSGRAANERSLSIDGSSTVYPITNDAATVWNSNPPAGDGEFWGPGQYGISTDERVANYWAGSYGFEATDEEQPFFVTVGLSHSGTGVTKVLEEQIDIGNSSAPVETELPGRESYEKFTNHVVGVDGQPIVVSEAIAEAGVETLTAEQLRSIYTGEITQWSEIDAYEGPEKEIQAVCRSKGSGTSTAFRANLFGDPDAATACDVRKGQNQQVEAVVANADNAIAYLALAFVTDRVSPIGLEQNGTIYELGTNLGAKEYPLSRDLHCYTWEGTSEKEAAFLRMLLSEYGQQNFVAPNNYFKLPPERRETQREKLPDV